MKTNPVGWFEIYVQDLSRSVKFYETVFATELKPLNTPFRGIELWAFPMVENGYGATGALVKMEGGRAMAIAPWSISAAMTVPSKRKG